MVIANESLEVSAFHLITFKEPIGCFPFIKGGNVPEELMSFFISSWDAHKVPLKQLTKWSFILALEQVCQRPIEILLSSLPVCYGYTTEQSQLKSALIFNRVLKLRLRIIRKDPSDSRDKAPTSALHWLFQELFAGLKVKFVTSHTHTQTHTHTLSSLQSAARQVPGLQLLQPCPESVFHSPDCPSLPTSPHPPTVSHLVTVEFLC